MFFCVVFMFPKKKKLGRGVGGYGLINLIFSLI